MTARPVGPQEPPASARTDPFEVIHLGGQAAVIVPLAESLRLWALERDASPEALAEAEDEAAAQDWLAREAAGQPSYTPLAEVKRRLGLAE